MDRTKIESEGVISFNHYINYCDHLSASLNQRDKEPIWDGDLHVYKSTELTNDNHRGVIRLQVKATTVYDSDAYAKFSIGTNELNAYFRDGGVLFIVVHVARSGNKCFYKMLTPVTISQLLKKAADQKSITITLGPLPQDQKDFEEDVFDFIDNSIAQHSYNPDNYASIMDWNLEDSFSFTINAHGKATNGYEFLKLLTKKPRQLYKMQVDNGLKYNIPLKEGESYIILKHDLDIPVFVGGQQIYDKIQEEFTKGKRKLYIGHCLMFEENTIDQYIGGRIQLSFEFKFQAKTLSDTIDDLRFSIAASGLKEFYIGKQKYSFDLTPENPQKLQAQLEHLKELKSTFEKLHVKEELVLSEIKKNELENGKGIIKAILHGEPISLTTRPNAICNITIGNIMILLKAEQLPDGKTMLTDFFEDMEPITFKDEEGNIFQSSPCIGMTTDDYIKVSNVNYNKLVESFKKSISKDPDLITHANRSLLAMLNAYDKKAGEKEYMIEAIRDFAVWIYKNDTDGKNKNINKLNVIQIIKRHHPLSEQDREDLYVILDSASDNQLKFAAYLLLDDNSSAKRYFNKLSKQEQQAIITMPIWKFIKE